MDEHASRLIVRGSDVRTGSRHGRLRVVGTPFWLQSENRWREPGVVCECTCGNVCVVPCSELRDGKVKSCGCLRGSLARAAR